MSKRILTHESNLFMRKFSGEATTMVCSLARFPLAQFQDVVKVLEQERYRKSDFGADEFDFKNTYRGPGGWLMIIRKIGESKWNIVRLGGSIEDSISDFELKRLASVLKDHKINVDLPKEYLEYIPPTDVFDSENPSETGRDELSDVNIKEAQDMEKKWHEHRLAAPRDVRTYY